MSDFFQSALEAIIVLGILGWFGIIYYSRAVKKTVGEVLKEIFSSKLYNEKPINEELSIEEMRKQIWQERRRMM